MASRYSAEITVDAGPMTRAVFDSIRDGDSYPGNPVRTEVTLDGTIRVFMESERMPHLRAGLNSMLRLIQAGHDSIESSA